jgi:hypothetical protein
MKTTTKLLLGAVVFTGLAYVYYRYKKPKKSRLNQQPQPQPQDDSTVVIDQPSTPRNESAIMNKVSALIPTLTERYSAERDLQVQNLSLGKRGRLIRNL